MAKTTSFGYTDSIAQAKQLSIIDLDFQNDFTEVEAEETEDGVKILKNTTSPLDQPERIRISLKDIANIYKDTGIDPSYMSVTKRGLSMLSQVNDVFRVTDENGIVDLPISAHLVVKTPINSNIDENVVMTVVKRAVSSLFETGSTDSTRLNKMLRGSLIPDALK